MIVNSFKRFLIQICIAHPNDTVFDFKLPRYGDLIHDTYLVVNITSIWSGNYDAGGKNATYNLGGNKLVSLKELISKSCYIYKKKVEVFEVNKYKSNIRNISSQKISNDIKWSPKINIEGGLKTLKKFV